MERVFLLLFSPHHQETPEKKQHQRMIIDQQTNTVAVDTMISLSTE